MVEQQRKRIEERMGNIIEEIDKTYLRKMQGDMHRCAAACCDNETCNAERVYKCVENCSLPLNKAQGYVQGEFERIKNRLQRCVMECNDKIKDKMGPSLTQNDINKFNDEFENCATKCVDAYCDLLPLFESTMKNVLSSKTFD